MMSAADRTHQEDQAGAFDVSDADGGRPANRGGTTASPPRGRRFDPARLWLGLWLLAIAAAFAARAGGHLDISLRVLALAWPVALVTTAGVAIATYLGRRRRLR